MVDLNQVRDRLNTCSETIILELKKRSRYKTNPEIYIPDTIEVDSAASYELIKPFLSCSISELSRVDISLKVEEIKYGLLGRYKFHEERALMEGKLPGPLIKSVVNNSEGPKIYWNPKKQIMDFYRNNILTKICEEGIVPRTYGESADSDAQVIINVNQRISLGVLVAQSKIEGDSELIKMINDPKALMSSLTYPDREDDVITDAKELAKQYEFDEDVAEELFRWMIIKTKELQVEYIKAIARKATTN